jgi:hypothetical protein
VYIQATGAPPPFRTGSYATISPQQAYILSSPPKTGDAAPATYYTTGYTTFGDSVIGDPSVASAHMDISGLSATSGPPFKLCTDEFQVIQLGDRAKPFVRINAGHNALGFGGSAGTLSTTYLLANLVATPSLQGVRTIVGNGGNGSEYGSSNIEIMTGLHGIASGDIKIGVLNTNHVIIGNPNNSAAQYGIPEIHLGSASTCGYIDCGLATAPTAIATGPTNICSANHNGYIGTWSALPATGTGLRGYSMLATLKTYMAPNLSPLAGGGDSAPAIKYSCIEGPQGFTMFRGQVKLSGFAVAIDIDAAVVVGGGGELFIPHDNPWIAGAANPPGTFNAMFQNPMVMVTNAGVWNAIVPPNAGNLMTLLEDPLWTPVRGSLSQAPTTVPDISNTHLKISARNPGGTPDLVVNYIIYAERRDEGYIDNSQVRDYINPFTRSTKTWGSATDLSGNPFP